MTIARITRTHGIRGEVVALSLTDFPERWAALEKVRVENRGQACWETLEGFRFHKDRVLLKFAGLDRPDDVRHLLGGEVQIPESERVQLPPDTYFHSDLIGCQVFDRERPLGRVQAVLETGNGALLEIAVETGEILIPLARHFLRKVDIGSGRIDVDVPADLIELNQRSAPRQRSTKEQKKVRTATRSKQG